jgi:hypothetical protein
MGVGDKKVLKKYIKKESICHRSLFMVNEWEKWT